MKLNNKNLDIQKWDAWNDLGGPNYPHEKVVQFCLRNYPSEKRASTRVLDLGCGTGVNTWFLSREGFTVTGTDISSRAIAATKSRLDRSGLLAKLRVEGANAINDPDESFDLIICIGVIEAVGPTIAKEVFERGFIRRLCQMDLLFSYSPQVRITGLVNQLAIISIAIQKRKFKTYYQNLDLSCWIGTCQLMKMVLSLSAIGCSPAGNRRW